jgi:lipid A disaccharide synthetase
VKKNEEIRLEIDNASWYEHTKAAKDMSYILPLGHPRRTEVETMMNKLSDRINKLKKETSNTK